LADRPKRPCAPMPGPIRDFLEKASGRPPLRPDRRWGAGKTGRRSLPPKPHSQIRDKARTTTFPSRSPPSRSAWRHRPQCGNDATAVRARYGQTSALCQTSWRVCKAIGTDTRTCRRKTTAAGIIVIQDLEVAKPRDCHVGVMALLRHDPGHRQTEQPAPAFAAATSARSGARTSGRNGSDLLGGAPRSPTGAKDMMEITAWRAHPMRSWRSRKG
jgi:hypothetical protein